MKTLLLILSFAIAGSQSATAGHPDDFDNFEGRHPGHCHLKARGKILYNRAGKLYSYSASLSLTNRHSANISVDGRTNSADRVWLKTSSHGRRVVTMYFKDPSVTPSGVSSLLVGTYLRDRVSGHFYGDIYERSSHASFHRNCELAHWHEPHHLECGWKHRGGFHFHK